jgi:hypothetical protein
MKEVRGAIDLLVEAGEIAPPQNLNPQFVS